MPPRKSRSGETSVEKGSPTVSAQAAAPRTSPRTSTLFHTRSWSRVESRKMRGLHQVWIALKKLEIPALRPVVR